MPLINGHKMACEPCIRGHRSTKCTHANERLMVPVRKPGRPLSSCPHPTSKPCSCGTVTAAIPRKQKCGCGTSSSVTSQTKTETDTEEASPATSIDEPRSTTSSYRVQKARSGSNRKMSIDPAGLERMDSSQLNIMTSYGTPSGPLGMQNGHISSMAGMSPYPVMGMASADSPFTPQPMMFPMFHHPMPSPMMGTPAPQPIANNHHTPVTDRSPKPSAKPAPKSCCGGGDREESNGNKAKSDVKSAPASAKPKASAEQPVASCCAPKSFTPDTKLSPDVLTPTEPFPQATDMMMPPYQHPIALGNGMYGLYPQPTVFTYPPQYGTFMQPLQPEQWRQVMASVHFGQFAQPQGFDMGGPVAGTVPYSPMGTRTKSGGTSHQCGCGDGCQCVGCAAHPYNDATQDYVRSAWTTMMEDQNGTTAHTNGTNHTILNGNKGHTHGSSNGNHTPTNGHQHDPAMLTDHALNDVNGASSTSHAEGTSTGPQTPSDAPSSVTEEQALSANDFFFVTYPFGDSCAGETASCPCGDECQCIGCVIHNNPAPA